MAHSAGVGDRSPATARTFGRCRLTTTEQLKAFVSAAARAGLSSQEAVQLALERELVLADAAAFGLDVDAARAILGAVARSAAARRPLSPGDAARVRRLATAQPLLVPALAGALTVELPDRVATRARGSVPARALDERVVAEMVAWELAALLDGRSMSEWALKELGRALRAA